MVELSGQAVTSDDEFSPLRPATGINSHCLRFRFIESIDSVTGIVTYDDVTRVYIYGPDAGSNPCAGLIVACSARESHTRVESYQPITQAYELDREDRR